MDWNAAIEKNREALKRVLTMLVAMAGVRPTLPRHLHRAVLRRCSIRSAVGAAATGRWPGACRASAFPATACRSRSRSGVRCRPTIRSMRSVLLSGSRRSAACWITCRVRHGVSRAGGLPAARQRKAKVTTPQAGNTRKPAAPARFAASGRCALAARQAGAEVPSHEVHEILNVAHGLAIWALKSPDTS